MKNLREKLSKAKKLIFQNEKITIKEIKEKLEISLYEAQQIYFILHHIDEISSKEDISAQSILKISKLSEELSFERKKVKKLQKEEVALQRVVEHLSESKLYSLPDTPIIKLNPEVEKENGIAVAVYTDQHIGKIVEPYETNYWNEHNPDIAKERFSRFTNGIIEEITKTNLLYKRSDKKIETLVLAFLGDGIQGRLREEDLETNAMHPTQEAILYKELLISSIRLISENSGVEDIIVIFIWGNHGRTSKKLKFSTGWANSYEYLAYQDVISTFDNRLSGYNNLKFYAPKSGIQEIELYPGYPTTFSHGFDFNYRGGIGGIEIPMHTWHYMMKEALPALRRWIGHWHIWRSGTVSICSSGLGYDGFCMHHKFSPELPAGLLDVIKVGKGISFTKKIIVDDFYKNKHK